MKPLKMIRDKRWAMEDEEYAIMGNRLDNMSLIYNVILKPYFLTWWVILDDKKVVNDCEKILRLVCNSNKLKVNNCRLKSHRS